jgi:hypothetical protein
LLLLHSAANLLALERLENGLRKLAETNSLVDGMKDELAALAPVLAEKGAATAELVKKVSGPGELLKRGLENGLGLEAP